MLACRPQVQFWPRDSQVHSLYVSLTLNILFAICSEHLHSRQQLVLVLSIALQSGQPFMVRCSEYWRCLVPPLGRNVLSFA